MRQERIPILENNRLGGDYFRMILPWTHQENPLPGQFLTIRVTEHPFPLLRRPFAFSQHDQKAKTAGIIYKVRGTATEELSQRREGDRIDVIGPLGTSFPQPPPGRRALVLAGGIGLGPMLFLVRQLKRDGCDAVFLYGCSSKGDIPRLADFGSLGACLCTDDGTHGYHGTVLDLANTLTGAFEVYGCGPTGMLKECHRFAVDRDLSCWVSMEQIMGCAMGACMGCVIRIHRKPGFARVCSEGPIFSSREILWT